MKNELNIFDGLKSVYYNTNGTPQNEVPTLEEKNKSQEKIILNLFRTSFPKWTVIIN